jgi:hypothetical protein
MMTIDLLPLLAAAGDTGLLGKVIAYAEQAQNLARQDARYQTLADALERFWLALLRGQPAEIRVAARACVDACDRIAQER